MLSNRAQLGKERCPHASGDLHAGETGAVRTSAETVQIAPTAPMELTSISISLVVQCYAQVAYGGGSPRLDMFEYCKPGDRVLKSGIYRVRHGSDCTGEHEVSCLMGSVFPPCIECGQEAQFSLVRYAADLETHHLFRPKPDRIPEVHGARHREVWDHDELQRLRELLAEGKSIREVADQLGRSEEATKTRAQKRGLRFRLA